MKKPQPPEPAEIEKQTGLDKSQDGSLEYQHEISAKYRLVFSEGVAREVLGDILAECAFPGSVGDVYLEDSFTAEDIGRFRVGVKIARKAGVLGAIGAHILAFNPKDKP